MIFSHSNLKTLIVFWAEYNYLFRILSVLQNLVLLLRCVDVQKRFSDKAAHTEKVVVSFEVNQ
jgi:hypothetical protein